MTAPFLTSATVFLLLLTYITQRKKMDENQKRAKYERFESTFFQLLTLNHQIVNDINYSDQAQGRSYFKYAYEKFLTEYRKHIDCTWIYPYFAWLSIFEAFKELYRDHQQCLAHYFRNLYNILRHIHESELTYEEKMKYVRFLRSQLSTYELLLLFYNAMVGHGFNKFKLLMVKYKLLEHLREDELASIQCNLKNKGFTCREIFSNDIRLENLDDESINKILRQPDNEKIM